MVWLEPDQAVVAFVSQLCLQIAGFAILPDAATTGNAAKSPVRLGATSCQYKVSHLYCDTLRMILGKRTVLSFSLLCSMMLNHVQHPRYNGESGCCFHALFDSHP